MIKTLQIIFFMTVMITVRISAQAPALGATANFALFSSNGAVSNTGLSQLTGDVGTNNGSSTNFGNVDGMMPMVLQLQQQQLLQLHTIN